MTQDNNNLENINEKATNRSFKTKKIATAAIFIGVGFILSVLNPFAYFTIFGVKINPFAHFINALMGVLIGTPFAIVTALGIAILRYSFGLGTIHAFHGGISGAVVVGISAAVLWKKKPMRVDLAALTEPIGTVFIGGTIAYVISPIGGLPVIYGLLIYWGLFALSSVPGCILGYFFLRLLRKAGISREDYYNK